MKLINLRKKEYFWLWWIFVAAHRLSLVAACRLFLVVASEGYSSFQCTGSSLQWPLLFWSSGSRHMSFTSYSLWTQ